MKKIVFIGLSGLVIVAIAAIIVLRTTAAKEGPAATHSLPRTGKPALKTPTTTLLSKPKAGQAISISLP